MSKHADESKTDEPVQAAHEQLDAAEVRDGPIDVRVASLIAERDGWRNRAVMAEAREANWPEEYGTRARFRGYTFWRTVLVRPWTPEDGSFAGYPPRYVIQYGDRSIARADDPDIEIELRPTRKARHGR